MSTHDRGAFGQLLAEAKALGATHLDFEVDLTRPDEDVERWACVNVGPGSGGGPGANGRTGEEALRGMVERLRSDVARGESQA